MSELIEYLRSLFTISHNPVIAVRDRLIVYYNPAAQRCFPQLHLEQPAGEILSAHLLKNNAGSFVSSCRLEEGHAVISQTMMGELRVFHFTLETPNPVRHSPSAVIGSIRNAVFTLRIAADKLVTASGAEHDETLSKYASVLYHNYHTLLHFTNNISTAESLAKDQLVFQPALTDMRSLCGDLCDAVRSFVATQGISFRFSCCEDAVHTFVDRTLIEQLLLNLFSNSLRQLDVGGHIQVSLTHDADSCAITVTDTGRGISPVDLELAFSRSPDAAIEACAAGRTGMGLYIVRGIAELHNGTVIIESRLNEGTTVKLILPLDTDSPTILRSTETEYRAVALNNILTELSGVLDSSHYLPKYLLD